MKTFGKSKPFPLSIDDDWVRIHCGVDGAPNYIFGLDGLKEFYEAGTGIYTRNSDGMPDRPLDQWIEWYSKEREERIRCHKLITVLLSRI